MICYLKLLKKCLLFHFCKLYELCKQHDHNIPLLLYCHFPFYPLTPSLPSFSATSNICSFTCSCALSTLLSEEWILSLSHSLSYPVPLPSVISLWRFFFITSVIYFHVAMVTLWAHGASVPTCQDLEKQRDQPRLWGREPLELLKQAHPLQTVKNQTCNNWFKTLIGSSILWPSSLCCLETF